MRSDATASDDSAGSGGEDLESLERGDLATRLMELSRQLHGQDDPAETLLAVVSSAVRLVPGADDGSLSLVAARRTLVTEAASSTFASTMDKLQEQCGEGPCLDAVYEQHTVLVADTAEEERWPLFSARACAGGARSILALQLFVDGDNLGALNLYARQPHAFSEDAQQVGQLFASHAAMAYSTVRRQEQLKRAVTTRELIGQAQGILMERHKITADEAFGMLVLASQHNNVKLRDLAERLVRTGTVSDDGRG
ncbi:MAG TPA: GAF and ANTAR domain-containing protein [Egibacteraceae bacterium]|nr:GAF and ANTAR domain-containing protein [Egibacteraceae bacterium]